MILFLTPFWLPTAIIYKLLRREHDDDAMR